MNIIDIQDQLKDFSEQQLIREMQMPSGNAPQFLVLTEIQRRKRMRDDFAKRQAAAEPTVAQEALSAPGVPTEGIAGMSEAMAPQSAASDGIGTIMPQTMRQSGPLPAPMPDDMAMGMRSGGIVSLAAGGGMRIEERRMKNGQIGLFRGNTFLGLKEENKSKGSIAEKIGFGKDRDILGRIKDALGLQEGGVINANTGRFFPSSPRSYGYYSNESSLGTNIVNRKGDGVGPFQVKGSTAIQPGNKVMSLFPELRQAVIDGVYKDAEEAYMANKDMVDAVLMDASKTEPFVLDYDAKAMEKFNDPNRAAAAFNLGFSGAENYKGDISDFDYVKKFNEAMGKYTPQSKVPDVLAERGVSPEDLLQADAEPSLMSAMAASNDDESSGKTEPVYESRKNQGLLGKLMNKISPPSDIAELEAIQRRDRFLGSQVKADKESISALPDAIKSLDKKIAETPINTEADVKRRNELRKTREGLIAEVNQKEENLPEKEAARGRTIDLVNEAAKRSFDSEKNEEISKLEKALSIATNDKDKAALEKKISDAKQEKFTPKTSDDFDNQETSSSETTTEAKTDDKKEKESNISIDKTSDTSGALSLSDEIKALQDKMDKNRESDKWLALAQAGLALMSSDNPTLLGAAGEAGIEGLKAMREANERYEEGVIDLINARAKIASKTDKGALTASNAITRLGQLQKALSGADGAMMTESEKAEARNEVLILKRFLQERGGLPVYAAMTPKAPAA